jgi:hypothetical protein
MEDHSQMTTRVRPIAAVTGLRRAVRMAGAVLIMLAVAAPLAAQKDYYKLDKNRPTRISDAYTTERYAIDVKIAPLTLEREAGGVYHWGFDPEIAYGILPRTSIEVGFPYAVIDAGSAGQQSGLAGIELSVFHNLNVETRTLPALGIRGDVVLPVGSLSGDRMYPALTGIATRTFSWARFHVNGQYAFGAVPEESEGPLPGGPDDALNVTGEKVSRWLAGVAVDRVFPLRALLVVGNVYARQPLHEDDPVEWNVGGGVRYQVNPYLVVDSGLERRLTGDPAWQFTVGAAYQFALRGLIPVPR